jgi:hypothetical protein
LLKKEVLALFSLYSWLLVLLFWRESDSDVLREGELELELWSENAGEGGLPSLSRLFGTIPSAVSDIYKLEGLDVDVRLGDGDPVVGDWGRLPTENSPLRGLDTGGGEGEF